jgi:predicted phosphodiesterase
MKPKRILVYSIILIASIASWSRGETPSTSNSNSQRSIIFISDTQKPMWFERIFIKTHDNEKATEILLNSISRDTSVSTVFFLGDVTSMGSINSNWMKMDTFLTILKTKHVSAYASAGNHEYLLSSTDGEANFRKRFPDFNRTGYTVRVGSFAMVLLNSNFGELNHDEENLQQEWYTNELNALDQDSTVKIVAVGCHRPPYSNSSIVGYSARVREQFVPPFTKSNKCRFFLSGHAHTFQHFKDTVANKDFLVIGGGGGLLHTLKSDKSGELQDQVHWRTDYRMFHFLRGTLTSDKFVLVVMMLTEDLQGPYPVYELDIPLKNN